jgi:hypothetical protein
MRDDSQLAVHNKIAEILRMYHDSRIGGSEFALWLFNQLKISRTLCALDIIDGGCGHQLSESEIDYYDNRPYMARLCKRCVMEERAR